MTTNRPSDFDSESLKKEIKHELLKQEIMRGLEEDEIDIWQLGQTLIKRWRMVLLSPLVVAFLVAIYSLTLPNFFKAETTIFVHSKSGGVSALLGSLPIAGMLGGVGGGSSAEYLMAYLQSRTLTEKIIQKFGVATNTVLLGDPLPKDLTHDDILLAMKKIADVSKNKDGLITVAVETKSPELSAAMAEAFLDYLRLFAKGPAKEKCLFIENQLKKTKDELVTAELEFKQFQDENKMFSIDQQSKALVDKVVQLESARLESEISLEMKQSISKASGNLPQLVQIEGQKVSEEAKLAALNKEIATTEIVLQQLPELSLQYVRLQRNRMIKEKIHGMLTEQHELAKISEAEESSQFEIMDHARPPERKSKPRRAIMVILAWLAAEMLTIFAVFFTDFWEERKRQEEAPKPA